MAEKPLRLVIFTILYLFEIVLTIPDLQSFILERAKILPPEALFWLNFCVGTSVLALLMLLIGVAWLENRIAYTMALLFVGYELAAYSFIVPNPKPIHFVLETIQLALLLSLFKHFFKR